MWWAGWGVGSDCAKVLRYQTNKCPICRQPVESLLQIKVNAHESSMGGPGADLPPTPFL